MSDIFKQVSRDCVDIDASGSGANRTRTRRVYVTFTSCPMMKRIRIPAILRRLQPAAINIGLMLVSLGLACGLAEAAIRIVAPQQLILIRPDLWMPADTVGWLHRPNVHARINTGERTVDVFTDAQGFRVGANGPTQANRQILFLGDSFAEALQVDHEQSTAGLLEQALHDLTDTPVAVRNAGVGGWGPAQYASRARTLLAGGAYDLVIVSLYVGNDVVKSREEYLPPRAHVERYRIRIPRRFTAREVTDAFLRPINDFLEVRSELFLFFRTRLHTLRMRLGLSPLNFPRQFLKSEASDAEWSTTADICKEINDVANRHGAQALFVLVPAPFQVDSASFRQYVEGFHLNPDSIDLDQPTDRLAAELSVRGLHVYDPLPDFRTARADGQQLYGTVDPHFSPAGHQLLVKLIAPIAADLIEKDSDRAE